jgi:hypothetical protein
VVVGVRGATRNRHREQRRERDRDGSTPHRSRSTS